MSTFPHVTAEEGKVSGLKCQAKFPSSSDSSSELNSEFGQLPSREKNEKTNVGHQRQLCRYFQIEKLKKERDFFFQVRRFAWSLMEHGKNLLITRHSGIKLANLPKVTGTK